MSALNLLQIQTIRVTEQKRELSVYQSTALVTDRVSSESTSTDAASAYIPLC